LELTQFKQLEHDYIGYQSLTDVPKALAYEDEIKDLSVIIIDFN
jgi:phosphorylase kinase alpha/beta subunit